MSGRKKQSFLHGAVILAAATLAVKLVGACFKIPLANLIGGEGMGDFSIAYDIFRPLNALAVAGLPVAVAKLTSESAALGRWRDARRIMRLSTALFLVTGLLGFFFMFFGARMFAGLLGSADSWMAIAALSPAVFFCCMMSAWRGYYQGLKNMYPTAVSQVVEAVVKLGAGIMLSLGFMQYAVQDMAAPDGWVRGLYSASAGRQEIINQFGAVGAVMGVTLSTLAGTLFLWLRNRLGGDGITPGELAAAPAPDSTRRLLHRMVQIAVPVCLGSLAVHLTTLIDLGSIMNRLDYCLKVDRAAVLGMYEGLIPQGHSAVSKYLYGAYSGMAVNIFNLVPSLTTTLGVSILPSVASAWAVRNSVLVKRNIESVLRVTALIALPAGMGLIALAQPVTLLLYGAKPMEAQIAAMLLRRLGLPMVLVALTTPVNAVLQAIGREDVPVKLMVAGGVLKLATNFCLMSIPRVNIQGAPVGTALCYLLIVVCSLHVLARETRTRFAYFSVFGKPAFAGLLCAVAAGTAQGLLARLSDSRMVTVAAIAVGGAFYAAVLLLTRAILKEDVLMLPRGEKIAKILEKHSLIG